MSASAAPKQGDHVFDAIELAIMRPFDSIRAMRSDLIDGEHFLHDFLLHSYSIARKMAETRALVTSRKLVASAAAEADALREIAQLRTKYTALARITGDLLHDTHLRNAEEFGYASDRFEFEFLMSVQESLEAAVAPVPQGRRASPGIAFQQMIDAGYDPAAALVVVTRSMSRETASAQAIFQNIIVGISQTLNRPAMWRDPYNTFREERPTATGTLIAQIWDMLVQMEVLKAQGSTFGTLIKGEIVQKTGSPQAEAAFGAMLHLLHGRLQQMRDVIG